MNARPAVSLAALLALAGCIHASHAARPALSPNARALHFAKLVDGDGRVTQDATIIVDGDRIVSVGSGDGVVPSGVAVVDLRKYTAIPGLIDVHTHMTYWWDHAPGTKPFGPGGTRRTPSEIATVAMANANAALPAPWLRGRITALADILLAVKTQADSGADIIKCMGPPAWEPIRAPRRPSATKR